MTKKKKKCSEGDKTRQGREVPLGRDHTRTREAGGGHPVSAAGFAARGTATRRAGVVQPLLFSRRTKNEEEEEEEEQERGRAGRAANLMNVVRCAL